MDMHVKNVEKKVSSGLYALNSLKHCLSRKSLRALYFATVHSHLVYGCLLWGNTHKKVLHKLKMLQNKAVRIMSHAKYNASSDPLYKENRVLKLEDMYESEVCKLMSKIYHANVQNQ